ncbi:hypothetical protein RP29_06070 [Acidovorax temperans]|uniref:Uncharacterized protein n=1 Tax=Acidovorax temperans TaxID=80878 RepID=A0A0D7KAI2_9BURK|nr:hypothetical protein RP29_06070 [Acidovorax temperans]
MTKCSDQARIHPSILILRDSMLRRLIAMIFPRDFLVAVMSNFGESRCHLHAHLAYSLLRLTQLLQLGQLLLHLALLWGGH